MKTLACLLPVLLGCGAAPPAGPPPAPPPAKKGAVEFRICRASGSIEPGPWEPAIMQFVGWAAGFSMAFSGVSVALAPCTNPPATCYASSEHAIVYCSVAMFERLARSAAALAAIFSLSGHSHYAELSGDDQRGPATDAFQFGMANAGSPEFLERVEAFRRADVMTILHDGAPDLATRLYAEIGVLVFQYVVGHELTHANHETCAVEAKADVESSGLFDQLVKLDLGSTLFCSNDISVTELRADRCALRQLRSRSAYLHKQLPESSAELALRGSAALLSWYAFSGYMEQPMAPRVTYLVLREYLRGPLRGLLISSELAAGLSGPRVCGEAARIFTTGVQEQFRHCEKNGAKADGDVPDLILNQLPAGVERGWAAPNQWGPNSFACDGPAGGRP